MKKIIILLMSLMLLCACDQVGNGSAETNGTSGSSSSSTATESIPKSTTTAVGSSFNAEQTVYINLTNLTSSGDNSNYDGITTTKTKYFDDTVKVDFTKYNGVSNGVIRVDITDVTKATAVHISGSNDAVKGIKIQTSKTEKSGLQNGVILDNVTITSGNFPCIEMTKKGSVNVQLIGTNILTDGRSYGTGYGEEYSTTSGATYEDEDGNTVSCTIVQNAEANGSDAKGTLYARGDMTIYGEDGTLNVTQHYKNCIASKMILTIENGSYSLTSTGKNGLYGDYAVNMKGGEVTFSGMGSVSASELRKANGIKTDDDTYIDSFVSVDGGTLNVTTAYGKGISSPVVNLAGGTNTITVNSPTTKQLNISSSYVSADGVSKSATESFAPQGISGDTVNLTGGSWTIVAPWSGIDCDGNMSVSGGTVNITTTANGLLDSSENDYDAAACIKVSGNMTVSGGTITGSNSGNGGKGIKVGGTYSQTNGTVNLEVTGSNLGSSGSSNMGGGMSRPGQQSSSSSSASSSAKGIKVAGAMNISGGKLYVTANSHEAIETKSTLTISGGEVYGYSSADDAINSSSHTTISGGYVVAISTSNDALDANGNMNLNGGYIYAVTTAGSPEVAIDANTESNYKLYINSGATVVSYGGLESGYSASQSIYSMSVTAGGNNALLNSSGSAIAVFKAPSNISSMVVTASSLSSGKKGVTVSSSTSYCNGYLMMGTVSDGENANLTSYSGGSSMGGGQQGGPGGNTPPGQRF